MYLNMKNSPFNAEIQFEVKYKLLLSKERLQSSMFS